MSDLKALLTERILAHLREEVVREVRGDSTVLTASADMTRTPGVILFSITTEEGWQGVTIRLQDANKPPDA